MVKVVKKRYDIYDSCLSSKVIRFNDAIELLHNIKEYVRDIVISNETTNDFPTHTAIYADYIYIFNFTEKQQEKVEGLLLELNNGKPIKRTL